MTTNHRLSSLLVSAGIGFSLLLTIGGSPASAQTSVVDTFPPEPALIERTGQEGPNVHGMELINGTYEYTEPFLPLMTNTRDHRLGVSRKIYVNNGVPEVRFFLLKPEALRNGNEPVELAMSADGAGHWIDTFDMDADNPAGLKADADDFHTKTADFGYMHFSICDETDATDPDDIKDTNPYVCDSNKDCYDFNLMLALTLEPAGTNSGYPEAQLFSTRVRVKVAAPKTAGAYIESAEIIGSTVAGQEFAGTTSDGIGSFHTPIIAGPENELLVVRIGGKSVPQYTDENGNLVTTGRHDMVYSVNPNTNGQCNVAGWQELRPVSFAHIDTDVAGLGFAHHQFRTPSDHPIEPHEEFKGNYLWVDQDADNLFFASLGRHFLNSQQLPGKPLYDYTCFIDDPNTTCSPEERRTNFRGWMMAGLWTQGKMVLLDSKINNNDFGLRAGEQNHVNANLYSDRILRVGTGEEATKIQGGDEPPGWARTTVQLGSIEHFLNSDPAIRPRTGRDVVWHVTAGAYTDEIAFDDLISPRMLIFSPMNALKEMSPNVSFTYFDGNQSQQINGEYPMRLQNAATSLTYDLPEYGEVNAAAEEGRIENVALGGIDARGFYLFPQSSITYDIPNQSFGNSDWMVSLFLDRRGGGITDSRLFTFPSGAYVDLKSNTELELCGSNNSCSTVVLPKPLPTKAWSHVALVLLNSGQVQAYQDGFIFAELTRPTGMTVAGGDFEVGKAGGSSTPGFEGWIDEFKVASGPFTFEEVCNHARGTLVSMPHHYHDDIGNRFADLASPFNNTQSQTHGVNGREKIHKALYGTGSTLWPLADYYVCNIDYTDPRGVSVNRPGDSEIRSLRQRFLFGEGPIIFDQPRPVSTANQFCLSCHTSGRTEVLGLEALQAHSQGHIAAVDTRRMPLQAPAELLGLIPAHHINPSFPAATQFGPSLAIDQGIHIGPLYRWGLDEAGGLLFTNLASGDIETGHAGDATATTNMNHKPGSDGGLNLPGTTRGHGIQFAKDTRYLRVDDDGNGIEPSIDGNQLTLAAWLRLDNDGNSTAETVCTPFTLGQNPCMIVAKSGGHVHDITWGLRIFKNSTWRVQMHITNSLNTIKNRAQDLGPTFDPAKWHHIAAVYNDGEVEVYLDGVSLGSPVSIHSSSQSDLSVDDTEPITVGAKLWNGSPTFQFYGRLDEVHVYDRALAAWELADLHENTP